MTTTAVRPAPTTATERVTVQVAILVRHLDGSWSVQHQDQRTLTLDAELGGLDQTRLDRLVTHLAEAYAVCGNGQPIRVIAAAPSPAGGALTAWATA